MSPYWFDGNNLIGQSVEAAEKDQKTRRAFLRQLSQFASLRGGFVVFFDGDDADLMAPARGISVRYSAPLSTDDLIQRRLGEAAKPAEVIVVTNDLDLQRRCRNIGSKAINWKEFSSKNERIGQVPAVREKRREGRCRRLGKLLRL